jgi:hypothetical protein
LKLTKTPESSLARDLLHPRLSPIMPPGVTYRISLLHLDRPRSAARSPLGQYPLWSSSFHPRSALCTITGTGWRIKLRSIRWCALPPFASLSGYVLGLTPLRPINFVTPSYYKHAYCSPSFIVQYPKANSRMRDCPVTLFGYGKDKSFQSTQLIQVKW